MLEAVASVLLVNINWWVRFDYIATSGFPLAFFFLAVWWSFRMLPSTMYDSDDGVRVVDVCLLCFLMDMMQVCVHYSAHTFLKNTAIGNSHMLHHEHRKPTPQDAFYTGFVDATTQLMLPLWCTLHIVTPSKWTAIVFGCAYSWWLLFIHSSPERAFPLLSSMGFVTPRYHHEHHRDPTRHFSHLLTLHWGRPDDRRATLKSHRTSQHDHYKRTDE